MFNETIYMDDQKGFVRLEDHMGSDASIVRSARISTGTDSRGPEKDARLIHRLWRDHHVSPFESVVFTFHVKAPIFVARQWTRHSWHFNEYSLRYSEAEDDFYVPNIETIQFQNKMNKQGRDTETEVPDGIKYSVISNIRSCNEIAYNIYKELVSTGISREIARMVLPVTYYTQFYGTVNLRNLFHFMDARSAPDAQWEIQQYSKALETIVQQICPVAYEAWQSN